MHKKWLVIGLVFHLLWTNAESQTAAPVRFLNDSLFVAPQADGPLLGLFDLSGRQPMPFAFTEIEAVGYSGRLKARKKDTRFGLFDTAGRELTFLELADFEAGDLLPALIFAKYQDGKWAVLNLEGRHLKYPDAAKKDGIQGMVYIQFVVEKDGSLSSPLILRDIGGGCGAAAIEVVKKMPRWLPASQNGRPVRAKFTLPVRFKL